VRGVASFAGLPAADVAMGAYRAARFLASKTC